MFEIKTQKLKVRSIEYFKTTHFIEKLKRKMLSKSESAMGKSESEVVFSLKPFSTY